MADRNNQFVSPVLQVVKKIKAVKNLVAQKAYLPLQPLSEEQTERE